MRPLTPQFRTIIDTPVRFPDYKIYAWDSKEVTMSQIVSAKSSLDPDIPAPVDLTPYATNISWTDKQLTFDLIDTNENLFHPDYGAYKEYLKDQSIIRLVEGDARIDEIYWINSFTGQIHGQIGWVLSRRNLKFAGRVAVLNRGETPAFKKRRITSDEYTVGTDLGIALYDICDQFMGLTAKEIRIPQTIGRQFKHKSNQLCEVTPWDGISSILEVVCYLPTFDGDGKLTYINKSVQRQPDKILTTGDAFAEYEIPERTQDYINKVIVTFLDANLERISGHYQKLGTAEVTTGFFSLHESLQCWWSEDRKQRAVTTEDDLVILKSVNSGLLPVGSESYEPKDDFHGTIEIEISVWVPILFSGMVIAYVAAAFIPDGVVIWSTIPIGRVIQAMAMMAILGLMLSLGSAQYEIWGVPYEYAYLEKRSVAQEAYLEEWMINEMEIRNDFLGDFDQADTVALTELIWQKALSCPRRIFIRDDPSLEAGDIIVIPDGRKIMITSLSKTIKRGEVPTLLLEGGKIMNY